MTHRVMRRREADLCGCLQGWQATVEALQGSCLRLRVSRPSGCVSLVTHTNRTESCSCMQPEADLCGCLQGWQATVAALLDSCLRLQVSR